MGAVLNMWNKFLDKAEPVVTFELDEIIFSKKHGHEVCIMHIVGKNIFPIMTTEEILSNKQAMIGLGNDDFVRITRLDMEIRYKENNLRLIEVDRNGTVLVENQFKERIRYSEKMITTNPEIQDKLNSRDAIGIGYRVGLREGLKIFRDKTFFKKILSLLRF